VIVFCATTPSRGPEFGDIRTTNPFLELHPLTAWHEALVPSESGLVRSGYASPPGVRPGCVGNAVVKDSACEGRGHGKPSPRAQLAGAAMCDSHWERVSHPARPLTASSSPMIADEFSI